MQELNTILQTDFSSKIFNIEKTDYTTSPIFLGQDRGLADSINRKYPELFKIYKTLKRLDWDEVEFDFSTCNVEFKTCDRDIYEEMISTLAWQWEADTVAANSVVPILAPFISSNEVWNAYCRIQDNENLHALTYSEIVRLSFDDPSIILGEVLKVKEAHNRMKVISKVFEELYKYSHLYALNQIPASQELYERIFLFIVALYALERIEFMASFAVTFGICNTGLFQPIGMAVQKIAQDEFEIHARFGEELLKAELATERGRYTFNRIKDKVAAIINEVVNVEYHWNYNFLNGNGRKSRIVDAKKLADWTSYCAAPVYFFFGLEDKSEHPIIEKNPLSYMEDWMNIAAKQTSPQEQNNNQYKLGVVSRTPSSRKYDFNFGI